MSINIELLASSQGVTPEGIAIVKKIMVSEPNRRVRANSVRGNKTIRYPSKKMGVTIQAESELEFCGLLTHEYSNNVVKFFDQPPAIDLTYQSGSRKVRQPTTLDYFVISYSFIGYEEWKLTSELEKIAEKRPDHICFDPHTNRFVSPAVTRALSDTGLGFRICTEKDVNPVLVSNIDYLQGYFKSEPDSTYKSKIEKISRMLSIKKIIFLKEIGNLKFNIDIIYFAIAKNYIYFPMNDMYIDDYESAMVFADGSAWESYRSLNLNQDNTIEEGVNALDSRLLSCSSEQISQLVKKLNHIKELISGIKNIAECARSLNVSERTVRRYRASVKAATTRNEMLCALIPKIPQKGNRTVKIPSCVLDKTDDIINEYYKQKKAVSAHKICLKTISWCEKNKIKPPSKSTLYDYLKKITPYSKILARQGAKAAYQEGSYRNFSPDTVSFRARYYLARCHIDHTQMDIELVDQFGMGTGKPWLTIIVDEYTGMILSFYISYRSPNYISVMMAIRGMVRDHGKIPVAIVVDGGKEFQSKSFETFCAIYDIAIHSREGQPRAGGTVERKFGACTTQLVHNLDGNTKFMKNVRQVSASHNPKNEATWTIFGLAKLVSSYVHENNFTSAVVGKLSPVQLIENAAKLNGERGFLNQIYDHNLAFHSMPQVERTLKKGKPIVYDHHEYWHHSFSNVPEGSLKVEVKWDPEDSEILYVFRDGSWLPCRLSSARNKMRTLEKAAAAEAMRQEAKINRKAKNQSYVDMSSALDEAEQLLSQGQIDYSEASVKNHEKNGNKPSATYSLFDLKLPNSRRK